MTGDSRTRVIQVRAAAMPGALARDTVATPSPGAPGPRGPSILRALAPPAPRRTHTAPDLPAVLAHHYLLLDMEYGDGYDFRSQARSVWGMSREEVEARYAEERPRLVQHLIGLTGKELGRYGATGLVSARTVREWIEALFPDELLAEHKRLVGPAEPRHPLVREFERGVLLQGFGPFGISKPPAGPGHYVIDVNLAAFDVVEQERGGSIHVIITPKRGDPRASFTRREAEGRTDREQP